MRKRTVISILITGIFLALTKAFWLVKVHGHHSFKLDIFLIILILSFLFIYKLTDYIADFKKIKEKSRIDIIFLTIFFVFLFVPMSHINQGEISEQENRTLAKWKPFITKKNKINYNFGKDFENWFNDRFYLRSAFIDVYNYIYIMQQFYETSNIIIDKKSGFCFSKGNSKYNYVKMFQNDNLFTNEELKKIHDNFTKLANICSKNNVSLYLILEPDKETLYPEFYPKYYKKKNPISRMEQVENLLKDVKGLTIINQKENLLKAKNEGHQVFTKTDSHNSPGNSSIYRQTSYGALVQYKTITDEIKKRYPRIRVVSKDDLKSEMVYGYAGNIVNKSKFSENFKENMEIFIIKNPRATLNKEQGIRFFVNNKVNNGESAVIIGDSFTNKYTALLGESFNKYASFYISGTEPLKLNGKRKKMLKELKPNILMIESTERFLNRFVDMDLNFIEN